MSTPIVLLALALAAEPAPAPARAPAGPVITLEQALQQAHEKNLDLKAARERLVQTDELSRKVLANYLPTLTVGGSYTRNQYEAKLQFPTTTWYRDMSGTGWESSPPPGLPTRGEANGPPAGGSVPGAPSDILPVPAGFEELTIQKQDMLALQIKLQQAILVPALWPAFSIADLGEEIAKMSVENARREILFGVLQLYYLCVGQKEFIGINERLLQNTLEHEKDARVRVEAGALPRIALIRAQIDRAKAELDLERAQNSYASAKIALGTLLDREEDFEVEHPAEPQVPADPDSLVRQAEQDRVDLQVARLNRELSAKTRQATWYKFAPSLLGTAQYQLTNAQGFTGEYGAWALGLVLGWTIWDGGLRESELRENASKLVESELGLKNTRIKARDEVRRAFLDLESSRSNRVKAEETVKLARENQTLVTVNYQAGAATPLDVSDATTQLALAEKSLVAETLNAQLAALKLVKAAGGFNPRF